MGDSSMSASELRNRYHQGGSAGDADLSASQLRARYGIASNRAGMGRRPSIVRSLLFASLSIDFSRRASETRRSPPPADFSTGCKDRQNMAMGAAAAVVVVLLVLYFSLGGSSAEPERIVLTRG